MIAKEDLLKILKYAKDNCVAENCAARELGFGKIKLSDYKKKYGIQPTKRKLGIDKDTLIKIINYSKEHNVTEEAAKGVFGVKLSGSLTYYKKKYGIEWKKPVTKEQAEEIIEYSLRHKIPEKEACKIYGINEHGLYQIKKRLGIKVNPVGNAPFTARGKILYKINDDFFSVPNLLNCYYAGFFAADGCINQNKRVCIIQLSSKDKEWLLNFAKDLQFTGVIHDSIAKGKFPQSKLQFNSSKIAADLNTNFNITPKKSLTLLPPNIKSPELIDAFICGYIDGDGCICFNKSKKKKSQRLLITVLGTYDMVAWIKKRFCEIIGKDIGFITHKSTHSNKIFSYSISDKNARHIFLTYYSLNVPKLSRKWSNSTYEYCNTFKKKLPMCRRKGVNIFNLNGELLKKCETLQDAHAFSNVPISTISRICHFNDNKHMANGYMFSRCSTISKYCPPRMWNGWKQFKERLINEGKINAEDFPYN